CADENDFTYFGKAFFKESLPTSTSFSEAFSKARALVASWESADDKKDEKSANKDDAENDEDRKKAEEAGHSEPQIYHTALIDGYLKRWRAQIKITPQPEVKPGLRADAADRK
ncbi:MAG: hypothetical protein ACXU7D_12545, partial [Burkholderiaceae bacterium]